MRKVLVAVSLVIIVGLYWWNNREDNSSTSSNATAKTTSRGGSLHTGNYAMGMTTNPASIKRCDVTGIVVEKSTGRPLPAMVTVTSADFQLNDTEKTFRDSVQQSNESGEFTFPRLRTGTYNFSASLAGYLPIAQTKVDACNGDPVQLELDKGGVIISGKISDLSGGPIGGAVVSVTQTDMNELLSGEILTASAMSGPNGQYNITVKSGPQAINVAHEAYVEKQSMVQAEGEKIVQDFELLPASEVEGMVVTLDGEPVAGALVSFTRPKHSRNSSNMTLPLSMGDVVGVAADQDGRFRITSQPPGLVRLSARAPGYVSHEPTTVSLGLGDQRTGVVVRVGKGATVSGRVVRKEAQDEGVADTFVGLLDLRNNKPIVSPQKSGPDGSFAIHGVRDGTYSIMAFAEDAQPNMMQQSVTVDSDDIDDVKVKIATGSVIRGRVEPRESAKVKLDLSMEDLKPDNMSMSNIRELISQSMTAVFSGGSASADGNFGIKGVSPGTYKVIARTSSGKLGEATVEVKEGQDAEGVIIELNEGARISGQVVDERGQPVFGSSVVIRKENPGNPIAMGMDMMTPPRTNHQGQFQKSGLQPGDYVLNAKNLQGIRMADTPQKLTLDWGDDKTVTIRVKATRGQLAGRVVNQDGTPAPDAVISANSEISYKQPVTAVADQDGNFTVKGLAEGAYSLTANGTSGSATGVKAKTGDTVTLTLKAATSLIGEVYSPSGSKEDRYTISFKDRSDLGETGPQADGSFQLSHVAPGDYTLLVSADSGFASHKATLSPGNNQPVTITLQAWSRASGRLVDKQGTPVANAAYFGMCKGFMNRQEIADTFVSDNAPRTDNQGRFELGRLANGECNITFFPPDGAQGLFPTNEKFDVQPGQDAQIGDVTMNDATTAGEGKEPPKEEPDAP